MAELLEYRVADGVACLTMDNPPLNALGHGLRAALANALREAAADPAVLVVVLLAAGRSWPVGADIREFGQPPQEPTLPDLCAQIAALDKPVIAAIHGTALGGGLELALAASARVADRSAEMGLPEVTLGILPGAGGTQRLPRLIGAGPALEMILSGKPVRADQALASGLVDRVASSDLAGTALQIARAHVEGRATLPTGARRRLAGTGDPDRYLAAIAAARARARPAHDRAARRIIDCVEAALLLPPDEGFAFERAAFADLVGTPEARALRHAFFAERRAARSLPAGAARSGGPAEVAIIGEGAVAAALSSLALARGAAVRLIAPDAAELQRLLARIGRGQDQAPGALRLTGGIDMALAGGAGLVLVCGGPAERGPREARLAAAEAAAPDVPVFSLCAGSAEATADGCLVPGSRRIGLYLTEPVARAQLAELMFADDKAATAIQTLGKLMGWRLLRPGPVPGFLGPLYWTARRDAADRCLALGALPHEVDRAERADGQTLGPFELSDLLGVDHAMMRVAERRASSPRIGERLRGWLAAQGRGGRRGGRGYYLYDEAGHAKGDGDLSVLLDALRPRQALLPEALQRRMLAGLANQGAWALVEGRAWVPSDFDLVAMAQGYPRWRGGPMQAADEAGLLFLRRDLRDWADAEGDDFWRPAPLWDELIRDGRHFRDLND